MSRFWLAFLLVLYVCSGQATDSIPYLLRLPGIRMLAADPLHAIYVIDADSKLVKIDTSGKVLYQHTNRNLGNIHSIDTGNPFKVMLFYRDLQTIVMLDNTLAEIERINLADWDMRDVRAVALAADNSIWMFEATQRKLLKADPLGDIIVSSDPFDLIDAAILNPEHVYDVGQFVFVKENNGQLIAFNDFAVRQDIYLPDITGPLSFYGTGSLIHFTGSQLLWFNLKQQRDIKVVTYDVAPPNLNHIAYVKGLLFQADDNGLWSMRL